MSEKQIKINVYELSNTKSRVELLENELYWFNKYVSDYFVEQRIDTINELIKQIDTEVSTVNKRLTLHRERRKELENVSDKN
jgi:hypothetical protein